MYIMFMVEASSISEMWGVILYPIYISYDSVRPMWQEAYCDSKVSTTFKGNKCVREPSLPVDNMYS